MRRYVAGLIVLVALLIGVIAMIPSMVPLNDDKARIIQQVKSVTGRDLTITGPLTLIMFPRLAIEAHGVAFANPPGSLRPAMVKLETIRVQLAILPLLWGRLEIAGFVLRKPEIDFEVAASGIPNWVFSLTPHSAAMSRPQVFSGGGVATDAATAALARLGIAEMQIEQGTLTLENRRNGSNIVISALTAALSLPGASGPLGVSGSGTFQNHRHNIDLTGTITITPTVAQIENASFKLDSIAGNGMVALDTGGSRPKISATLTLHRLDLNPYIPMPPTVSRPTGVKRGALPPRPAEPSADWDDKPLDFSILEPLDADLFLSADEIRVRKFDLGSSALHLILANGKLDVSVTRISAYGGRGSGSMSVQADPAGAAIQATFDLTGIQIQPLLIDGAGYRRLSGNASWSSSVTAAGRSQRDLIRTLAGTGAVSVTNGSIRGMSLLDMLADPILDRGLPGGQTNFEHLTATYVIVGGIVTNHDLAIKIGNLSAQGEGTADLSRRSLDYRLKPKRLGLTMPISITGPWDALRFHMPFGKPLSAVSKEAAKPITTLKNLFKFP